MFTAIKEFFVALVYHITLSYYDARYKDPASETDNIIDNIHKMLDRGYKFLAKETLKRKYKSKETREGKMHVVSGILKRQQDFISNIKRFGARYPADKEEEFNRELLDLYERCPSILSIDQLKSISEALLYRGMADNIARLPSKSKLHRALITKPELELKSPVEHIIAALIDGRVTIDKCREMCIVSGANYPEAIKEYHKCIAKYGTKSIRSDHVYNKEYSRRLLYDAFSCSTHY